MTVMCWSTQSEDYLSSYPAVHDKHVFDCRLKVCCCIITLQAGYISELTTYATSISEQMY